MLHVTDCYFCMLVQPPFSNRTAPLFPNPTLSRSTAQRLGHDRLLDPGVVTALDLLERSLDPDLIALLVAGLALGVGLAALECQALQTVGAAQQLGLRTHQRSEEHTSELQSLMRISYAVFCLKQKRK